MIPIHYDTFPPIETDAQAFKSDVENATETQGRRPRAGRDAHGPVTHAIVLIEAEREAMPDLGGALADVEGVAEAWSVTGEWDFVAMLRVRSAGGDRRGRHRPPRRRCPGIRRTHTMVAFEVFSKHDLEALFSHRRRDVAEGEREERAARLAGETVTASRARTRARGRASRAPSAAPPAATMAASAGARSAIEPDRARPPASSAPVAPWWQRWPRIQRRRWIAS